MTIFYRSKIQRINEIKPILNKLSELNIKACEHEEIRELLQKIQIYIQEGEKVIVDSPFPIADVVIRGILEIDIEKRVWIKFTKD